jgi:hypothetical protein
MGVGCQKLSRVGLLKPNPKPSAFAKLCKSPFALEGGLGDQKSTTAINITEHMEVFRKFMVDAS